MWAFQEKKKLWLLVGLCACMVYGSSLTAGEADDDVKDKGDRRAAPPAAAVPPPPSAPPGVAAAAAAAGPAHVSSGDETVDRYLARFEEVKQDFQRLKKRWTGSGSPPISSEMGTLRAHFLAAMNRVASLEDLITKERKKPHASPKLREIEEDFEKLLAKQEATFLKIVRRYLENEVGLGHLTDNEANDSLRDAEEEMKRIKAESIGPFAVNPRAFHH